MENLLSIKKKSFFPGLTLLLAGFLAGTDRTQLGVAFSLVYCMGLSGSDGRSDSALRSDAGLSLYPYSGDLRLSPLHGKQTEVETGIAVLAVCLDSFLRLSAGSHRSGVSHADEFQPWI